MGISFVFHLYMQNAVIRTVLELKNHIRGPEYKVKNISLNFTLNYSGRIVVVLISHRTISQGAKVDKHWNQCQFLEQLFPNVVAAGNNLASYMQFPGSADSDTVYSFELFLSTQFSALKAYVFIWSTTEIIPDSSLLTDTQKILLTALIYHCTAWKKCNPEINLLQKRVSSGLIVVHLKRLSYLFKAKVSCKVACCVGVIASEAQLRPYVYFKNASASSQLTLNTHADTTYKNNRNK